jgi:hypothetical protein
MLAARSFKNRSSIPSRGKIAVGFFLFSCVAYRSGRQRYKQMNFSQMYEMLPAGQTIVT